MSLKKCAHYWQGIQLCQIPLQTTSLCTFVTPPSSTEFDLRCKECLGEASTVVWFLMVFLLFVISLIFRFAFGNCHFIPHSKVPQRETIVTKFYLPHFSKRLDWRIHQRASQYLKCELGLTTDQGVSQDNWSGCATRTMIWAHVQVWRPKWQKWEFKPKEV